MQNYWSNKKVLVTGGTGFVGSYVCELLLKKKARVRVPSRTGESGNIAHIRKDVDIIHADLNIPIQLQKSMQDQEIVLHLASQVAGIEFNRQYPATMFTSNVRLIQNVIEAAAKSGVKRFLVVSSACVYPRNVPIPIPESHGFVDDPEPTNLGYGWSKRVAELFGKFYAQETDMKIAIARPFNAYGPRDNFDPKTAHVIPGLIKRAMAGENPLVVWGSGEQTRSFIYAQDLANGLITLISKYPQPEPVNLGSDEEITIGQLAKLIVKITGKEIDIIFDTSKPDGQPRRMGDLTRARQYLGFSATTKLKEGLKKTIEWYTRSL